MSPEEVELRKQEFAKRVEDSSQSKWALDTLGALAMHQGDIETARSYWRKSFEIWLLDEDLEFAAWIDPDMPEDRQNLAVANAGEEVREYLAGNVCLTPKAFADLSVDESFTVRANLAANPCCPIEILRILAQDEERAVRYEVARNPFTPPETIHLLIQDTDKAVRDIAQSHFDA